MEPLIGIYWYHGERLIVHSELAGEVKVVEGFADVDRFHYEYWETVRLKNPKLSSFEYEDVPRGRVVMKAEGPSFLAYGSTRLIEDPKFRERLLAEFKLPKNGTTFLADPHYEDPQTIDWDD